MKTKELVAALMTQLMADGGLTEKDVPSGTPNFTYAHGQNGLFNAPGLDAAIFSAMTLPRRGLEAALPAFPSVFTDPLYGILTGVTATTGSEPLGVCNDPPYAGLSKLCMNTAPFGRISRMSREIDITRAGAISNRGESMDLRIVGNALNNLTGISLPTAQGANVAMQSIAVNELSKAIFELAVAWSRDFARIMYTGTPTNNTAGGGYREFYGADTLINTGHVDAETNVACPAADSIVTSFGSGDVADDPAGIVRTITGVFRNLRHLASNANLDPVNWQLSMRFGLFYELTEIWPVAYATYRALSIPTGSTNFVNSTDIERQRDEMRGDLMNYTGQFLLIDGQRVPVILDDAITETQAGQSFTSDIYIIPMSVLGGSMPVTYMEYFDFTNPNGLMEMARVFAPDGSYYVSDGGRFAWHRKPPNNWCVQLMALLMPRLVMRTPYLAARIEDVTYTPWLHERSPFTADAYFVNGGRTGYSGPSFYPPVS